MAIPPGSLQLHLDAGNPSSYSGSGTAWNDLTFNNFDYTMVNPIWSASEGGYFTFVSLGDGAGINNYGYKTVPGAISPQQNDFTMQCWIRVPAAIPPGSLPDALAIFYNGDSSATYNGYGLGIKWAYYAFTGRMPGIEAPGFGGYYDTDPLNAFPSDTWTLFTLTIDSSSTLKIYYNDVLMRTQPSVSLGPVAPSASALCYIGTNNPSNTYPQAFNGDMAVIRFYDAALDAADIAIQYNTEVGRFNPPAAPVASYDVSNPASYSGTGNTLYDLTNSYDITLSNAPAYITYDNFKSLEFLEASSQFGTYNGSVGINTTTPEFTINAWVKPISLGADAYNFFIQYGKEVGPSGGGAPGMLYKWNGNNDFAATFGSGQSDVVSGQAVTLGAYAYFSVTSDGTTLKIYKNGQLIDSGSASGAIIGTPEQLRINGLVNNTILRGSFELTAFDIYTEALDAGTILQNYEDTKNQYVLPVIEYDFSETACYPGTGNTIFNLQPASYDFPIVNGATFVGAGSSSYFTFNGVNQFIGQGVSGGPGFGTTFTATVWVQANNGNIGSIWNSGFDSPLGREPGMYLNARAFSPDPGYADASFNFGIGYLDMASPQTIGDWFNLAYVADGTNVSLYVNGVLDSTGSQGGGQWAAGGFVLGAHLDSGGNVNGPFLNAKIGYYSAFDVALVSTQVSDIYNSQVSRFAPAPPPSGNGVGGRQFAQGFNG